MLLEERLVQSGSMKSSRAWGGAGVCVVGALGGEGDVLTLQHPWVSSRRPGHHVARNLLWRSSLQHHRGRVVVVVHGGIVAAIWS